MHISQLQYEYARQKIEELLPIVQETTPATAPSAIELTIFRRLSSPTKRNIILLRRPPHREQAPRNAFDEASRLLVKPPHLDC